MAAMTHSPKDSKPWYRYFWPWFAIGIIASGVVGGIVTIVIASQNPPTLIRDDIGRFGQVEDDSSGSRSEP